MDAQGRSNYHSLEHKRGRIMNKAADYRHHAHECLELARQADRTEHRDMLLQMANAWQSLADYRDRKLDPRGVPAALSSFVPQEETSSRFR
jgi:hypothetical protein